MIPVNISHYRILSALGAGGMGEVFRARDTRLGRDVAVKVLPRDFAADSDRLCRFEQEARTLAALNHPNIMTVFDVGQHEGQPYLVSELLDGHTLREALGGPGATPLPARKASDYAFQIAQGLSAAHAKGFVHRDLKPENLFITKDGRVKILDFGLAKLRETAPSPETSKPDSAAHSEALTRSEQEPTEPGRIMGTPNCMAPEQVRGESIDYRADLFAFGCVLFEMLSGSRPFQRDTSIATMAAIMGEEPSDLADAKLDLPPSLERIVQRCLEKAPDRRFQSATDLAFALETAAAAKAPAKGIGHGSDPGVPGTAPASPPRATPARRLALAVAALLLVVGIGWPWVDRLGQPKSTTQPSLHSTKLPSPSPEAPVVDRKSVAVLPFVNMSADKADEYLSDGLTEELVNALGKIKGLRVPGRSSSFSFKGKSEQDIFRIVGEQLHVQTVLEGSVRKSGNRLRITAQLISVADGFNLWSETYDGHDMTNIFAIQREIAARVAGALEIQLLGDAASQKKPTENMEAYKLYLQGRQLWNRRTAETLNQAVALFEEAIQNDPSYALAHAGLADCYVLMPQYALAPAQAAAAKSREAGLRALELDSSLAEPHASLAFIKAQFDWDWPGAEAGLRRAIALDPNYATAHHWLGIGVLAPQRRIDEALAEMRQAQDLDPLSPIINADLGACLMLAGKFDQGVELLQKQVALNPSFLRARSALAAAYFTAGRLPEAVAEMEITHRLDTAGTHRLEFLGFLNARAGRTSEAREALAQLQEIGRRGVDNRSKIAMVQHGLGDELAALSSLELAIEEKSGTAFWINADFFLDDLRPHPRFQAILKRMNLAK